MLNKKERTECVGRVSHHLDKFERLVGRALEKRLPEVLKELDCVLSDLQADPSDEMGELERQEAVNTARAAGGQVAAGLAQLYALHRELYQKAQDREIDGDVIQPRSGGR